ncbi:hypothetical protein HSX11_21685 [Oxalobacteraceae bacterium]|nr:hypothetical protein [Oxalobacteraceae bacterium]
MTSPVPTAEQFDNSEAAGQGSAVGAAAPAKTAKPAMLAEWSSSRTAAERAAEIRGLFSAGADKPRRAPAAQDVCDFPINAALCAAKYQFGDIY